VALIWAGTEAELVGFCAAEVSRLEALPGGALSDDRSTV
jgi:hypothetical protein